MQTEKKEFETFVYQGIKYQGPDELFSKLIAILYSESDKILKDLVKITENVQREVNTK